MLQNKLLQLRTKINATYFVLFLTCSASREFFLHEFKFPRSDCSVRSSVLSLNWFLVVGFGKGCAVSHRAEVPDDVRNGETRCDTSRKSNQECCQTACLVALIGPRQSTGRRQDKHTHIYASNIGCMQRRAFLVCTCNQFRVSMLQTKTRGQGGRGRHCSSVASGKAPMQIAANRYAWNADFRSLYLMIWKAAEMRET